MAKIWRICKRAAHLYSDKVTQRQSPDRVFKAVLLPHILETSVSYRGLMTWGCAKLISASRHSQLRWKLDGENSHYF
jgi:hypothetical protein